MSKDPIFQILCSTSNWNYLGVMPNTSKTYIFMCSRDSCSTENIKYSCDPELLTQHKTSILMCSRAPHSTQTSHQLCASGSMPNTWNHIHKTYAFGLCPIYQTNHHSHVQWGHMPNIQNKHQSNITCNGTYAHNCQVKNSGYYKIYIYIMGPIKSKCCNSKRWYHL